MDGSLVHPALVLTAAVGTMLLAAKAHGREVRLERERAGHHDVTFGGSNPEFVERLWARDRRGFWTVAPLAALALAALLWRSGWIALAALPGGLTVAFAAMGLASLARKGRPGRGSVAWWGTVAAGAASTVTLGVL